MEQFTLADIRELERFSKFLSGAVLNSEQEEFLMTIISYVCENGDITKEIVVNVASSHLARRCFVGNLYKQVKGPNIVGVGVIFINLT